MRFLRASIAAILVFSAAFFFGRFFFKDEGTTSGRSGSNSRGALNPKAPTDSKRPDQPPAADKDLVIVLREQERSLAVRKDPLEIRAWIRARGEIEGEAMLPEIARLEKLFGVTGLMTDFAVGWSRKDPDGAWRYAAGPKGGRVDRVVLIKEALEAGNQQTAGNYLQTMIPGIKKDVDIMTLAQGWQRKDATGAAAWIATLPSAGGLHDVATSGFVTGWAMEDPKSAAEWALVNVPVSQQSAAVGSAVKQWIERGDIRSAKDWVLANAEKPGIDHAMANVGVALSKTDSHASLKLAMKISDTSLRNRALGESAASLAYENPHVAVQFAEQISLAVARSNSLARAVSSWKEQDATAAKNYVENSTALSPDERARLKKIIDNG